MIDQGPHSTFAQQLRELNQQGFTLLTSALNAATIESLLASCTAAFTKPEAVGSALSSQGSVFAARNVINLLPELHSIWQQGSLQQFLQATLGQHHGLVRVLFFDKPPDRTWALPWHKDQSIAVQDSSLPSTHFSRPTLKAGVPHVYASDSVLQSMVTLRVHLDEVTDENGPLKVIPESHLSSSAKGLGPESAVTIYARAGDVLAMRPLIDHSSGPSHVGTIRHRRILHLEFAASQNLPDGYQWFQFIAATCPAKV